MAKRNTCRGCFYFSPAGHGFTKVTYETDGGKRFTAKLPVSPLTDAVKWLNCTNKQWAELARIVRQNQ